MSKRTQRTSKQIIADIERIRQAVLADSTIKPNDARWRRAVLECTALYQSLPNLHPDYHDDPYFASKPPKLQE